MIITFEMIDKIEDKLKAAMLMNNDGEAPYSALFEARAALEMVSSIVDALERSLDSDTK